MKTAKAKRPCNVKPLRVSPNVAAVMCCVSVWHIHSEIRAGVFSVIAPKGRGFGKRIYLRTEEVEAYANGGTESVAALRAQHGKSKTA